MDGFVKGIKDASDSLVDKTMSVEMVYANNQTAPSPKDFTSNFDDDNIAEVAPLTRDYLSHGADIIFPVAGPQIKLAIDEIRLERSNAKTLGVDGDQILALGSAYSDKIIGSALKELKNETIKALQTYANDRAAFSNDYIQNAHSGVIGFVGGKSSIPYTDAEIAATNVFVKNGSTIQHSATPGVDTSLGFGSVK